MPLGIHTVRHTYASLAAKARASVKMVHTQLGHGDPALTLRLYQHLFADDPDGLGTPLDEAFGESQSNPARPGDGLALVSSFGSCTDHAKVQLERAPGRIRTSDQRIRSPSLYPLSYGRYQEFRAAAL